MYYRYEHPPPPEYCHFERLAIMYNINCTSVCSVSLCFVWTSGRSPLAMSSCLKINQPIGMSYITQTFCPLSVILLAYPPCVIPTFVTEICNRGVASIQNPFVHQRRTPYMKAIGLRQLAQRTVIYLTSSHLSFVE